MEETRPARRTPNGAAEQPLSGRSPAERTRVPDAPGADQTNAAKPQDSFGVNETSSGSLASPRESRGRDWEDEITRIALEFNDRRIREAGMRQEPSHVGDPMEERHRQFVEKTVAGPVREIVEGFRRHGLSSSLTILQDRVIGTVEGRSCAMHIEFQGEEPVMYHFYSPDPPRTLARGDVRGLNPQELADLVARRFLRHIEEALRA